MGFLIPSALALAALALPIIIFYMLKLRRQPARVSSLMLWQQVLQDRQANAPWQRLRRNLLLLLQLIILALLVMALARPYFTVEARVQGNVVILLDASASMQATDVAPTRFAAAAAAARDLIDRLAPGDAVTLLAVEQSPRVLASTTTDHDALRRILNTAAPTNGPADWDSALTLAAASAATLPETTVVIISDGSGQQAVISSQLSVAGNQQSGAGDQTSLVTRHSSLLTPHSSLDENSLASALRRSSFAAPVEFIPIGSQANNQGLTALSLREGPAGPELFLRAFNAAPEAGQRLVEIRVNGELFDARRLELPAGGSASLTLGGLPLDTETVEARLTGQDLLAVDDTAWLVRKAAPARILMVGAGNLFLERALALLPNVTMQRAAPGRPLPESRFDLVIFDRTGPDQEGDEPLLPGSHLLFIAPPASTPLFEMTGSFTQTRLSRLETNDPVMAYVKLNNLQVAQAQRVVPPPWARTLIAAEGGPLLLAGQLDQQRVAVLTFDLHQSDLPLQIDFPILMVNLTRWLLPGGRLAPQQTLSPGQAFPLPAATTADALLIEPPQGEPVSLPSNQASFAGTNEIGLYRVYAQPAGSEGPTFLTAFAVNLLSLTESDIQPGSIENGETTVGAQGQSLTGQREWWGGLALVGLAILLVEWWVYWRGSYL